MRPIQAARFFGRRGIDATLDAIGAAADRSPVLAQWRTERFCREVLRRIPDLAVRGNHDVRYFIRPQDAAIGAAIVQSGGFDTDKVARVLGLLHQNHVTIDWLVDVGANIGTTTLDILRQFPSMRAVAFEPDPVNYQLLQLNLHANALARRVRSYQLAVGDAAGTVTLELADRNFGDHRIRLSDTPGTHGEQLRATIPVTCVRLDDMPDLPVGEHTLVYIDVQGYEGHVLAGARNTLSCLPPMVVELWPYGLDRAGGRDLLFAELRRYPRLYEIGADPPRPIAHEELEELARDVASRPVDQGVPDHTDLLALPARR
jgi:FkbM family methyltransferase